MADENESEGKSDQSTEQSLPKPPSDAQPVVKRVEGEHRTEKREKSEKPCCHPKVSKKAEWAYVFVSAILVVITGFILRVYSGQLAQMTKSTDAATQAAAAAKQSADSAKESVRQAKDTAHLDQRAWVTTTASQLVRPLVVGEIPEVVVTIINSGKTPALNVITGGDAAIERELSEPDVNFKMPIERIKSKFVLGPGVIGKSTCEGVTPITDQAEIDNLRSGKELRVYVRGAITYDDIFGKPHRTTFCAWINGKDLEGPTMHSCQFGNTAD